MKYISVGAVAKEGTEHLIHVSHVGRTYELTGMQAALWLNGRTKFSQTNDQVEIKTLERMEKMGLVVSTDGSEHEEYRTLARCAIVPAVRRHPYWFLTRRERTVLTWLRESGLDLFTEELIFLMDRKIPLSAELLGELNTPNLVQRIYSSETIFDNVLRCQMEQAPTRDNTIKDILSLLAKKRIVLI